MNLIEVGQIAPDAEYDGIDGKRASVRDWRGHPLVLYFYPKDNTGGCTKQAQAFTALMPEFAKAGVAVVGISKDSVESHVKFIDKFDLRVTLGSDGDGSMCQAFGVWVEKLLYGRKYMGIDRSTFLIGADGTVLRIWRKVKVVAHAESVLDAALQTD